MPSLQLAGGEPDPWCPSLRHRRCDQRETRDLDIEARSVFGGHMIAALHRPGRRRERAARDVIEAAAGFDHGLFADYAFALHRMARAAAVGDDKSEEHTSELQSLMLISYAVFCLQNKNTTT